MRSCLVVCGGFSNSARNISAIFGRAFAKASMYSNLRKLLLSDRHLITKPLMRREMAVEKLATSWARSLYAWTPCIPSTGWRGTVILQLLGIVSAFPFSLKRLLESQ